MGIQMVSKHHIDLLVGAALEIAHDSDSHLSYSHVDHKWVVVVKQVANDIGGMLWATNYAALQQQYGHGGPQEDWYQDVMSYTYSESDDLADASIGGLIKAVHSYVRQSSGTKYWATGEAKAFCDALIDGLIVQLDEYQDAPWVIEEYVENPELWPTLDQALEVPS